MHEKPFRKVRHQAYVGRERAITRLAEQFRAPPGMTTVVGRGQLVGPGPGGHHAGGPAWALDTLLAAPAAGVQGGGG